MSAVSHQFWGKLRRLVAAPAREGTPPPLPDPVPPFLSDLRRLIARRGSPETVALYRRLARRAAERIEAVREAEFEAILSDAQVGGLLQEAFTELFEGGLAAFRGRSEEDLLGFVDDRADRVMLRGVVTEWTDHEVHAAARARYGDLLRPEEVEELAAEAVAEMLRAGLTAFRGETAGELYAFTRTVAHRTVSRAARRRVRDRGRLRALKVELQGHAPPTFETPSPRLAVGQPLPLSDGDRAYLAELLALRGSKSELARARGVNRSAVTKMVQRILRRLDELEPEERQRVGEWAEQTWVAMQE